MSPTSRREFLTGPLVLAGLAAFSPRALLGSSETPAPVQELLEAVDRGDLPEVQRLLTGDPKLAFARDPEGRSAFLLSRLAGKREVASLFLENGYQPDLVESAYVLDWDRFEALALAAPEKLNQGHPIGGTPMFAAAVGGAGPSIWRVYRYGGDPNVNPRGTRGLTPLRAAFDYEHLPTAELTAAALLGNGADPNASQRGESSPLHAAAERGSLDLVEMLIRIGADVDARDDRGRRAIDVAREKKHRKVATLLRRHRDIPRDHSTSRLAYDLEGNAYTPPDLRGLPVIDRNKLVGSAHSEFDEVQAEVQKRPAIAHSISTTTESAVEASAHMGRREMVDYLLDRGVPYSLPTAVMRGDAKRASELLKQDPLRVHERGPHDFALLWYPIIGGGRSGGPGLVDLTALLLDHGAEVERQHHLGTTALHWAAIGGQIEMAEHLLRGGADIDRRGRKFGGEPLTPLELAQARDQHSMVRFLKERGAKG